MTLASNMLDDSSTRCQASTLQGDATSIPSMDRNRSSSTSSKTGFLVGLMLVFSSYSLSEGFTHPSSHSHISKIPQHRLRPSVFLSVGTINGDSKSRSSSLSEGGRSQPDNIDDIDVNSLYDKSFNVTDYVEIETETMVSPFAPPLTFDKFLTMQVGMLYISFVVCLIRIGLFG